MNVINSEHESIPVNALQRHPQNPRKGNVEAVRNSIRENGFYGEVVVQRSTGYILVGNHRYDAVVAEGASHIPGVYVDVDDDRAKRIMLADNRTSDLGEYNDELLADLLEGLKDASGAMPGTGYAPEDLTELLAKIDDQQRQADIVPPNAGLTDPDEAPEPRPDPVSVRGDVWLLGRHRLLCGDATSIDDFAKVMAGKQADLVVTDPPYNVAYTGKTADALTIENDEMDDGDFFKFLYDVYVNLFASTKDGGGIYVFHADTEGLNFRSAMKDAGWKLAQCCIWVKNSLVMGRQDYQWQHEPVLYGWKPGSAHQWNTDRKQTTVWNFDRPSRSTDHPTMKPIALVEYPIGNSSAPGELVLDPFGGSGSTLIACEKNGRICHTMELDPKYCDVIVRRWQEFTGKKAVREEDGSEFTERC